MSYLKNVTISVSILITGIIGYHVGKTQAIESTNQQNTLLSADDTLMEEVQTLTELDGLKGGPVRMSTAQAEKQPVHYQAVETISTREEPASELNESEVLFDDPRVGRVKEPISWADINKYAPHLSYEAKLDLETLAMSDHDSAIKMLAKEAKFPDTGDIEKDVFFSALDQLSPEINNFMFTIDIAYQERCGKPMNNEQLKNSVVKSSDLFFHYRKRNYLKLREEMYKIAPCT